MKIHLLTDSYLNPVLTTVMEELARQHEVAVFDAKTPPGGLRLGARPAGAAGRRPAQVPLRRVARGSRRRRSAPAAWS